MPSDASLANLRPWKPGQGGYNAGANRGARRVLAIARKASPEAMEKAVKCMQDEKASWRERLTAIAMILDRAWGAPKETLALEGAAGANIMIVTGVPRSDNDVADTTTVVADDTTYTIDMDGAEDDAP